jgi:hypothetical protein
MVGLRVASGPLLGQGSLLTRTVQSHRWYEEHRFVDCSAPHRLTAELNWVDPRSTQYLCTPMVDDRHMVEQNITRTAGNMRGG